MTSDEYKAAYLRIKERLGLARLTIHTRYTGGPGFEVDAMGAKEGAFLSVLGRAHCPTLDEAMAELERRICG